MYRIIRKMFCSDKTLFIQVMKRLLSYRYSIKKKNNKICKSYCINILSPLYNEYMDACDFLARGALFYFYYSTFRNNDDDDDNNNTL